MWVVNTEIRYYGTLWRPENCQFWYDYYRNEKPWCETLREVSDVFCILLIIYHLEMMFAAGVMYVISPRFCPSI
jgi:hypothetical protein